METQLMVELCILIIFLIIARSLYVAHKICTGHTKYASKKRQSPCKTIICIGSGGHTTEMMFLVESLDFKKYSPRFYIVAENDTTSISQIKKLEEKKKVTGLTDYYYIQKIPRSRVVGQSYFSSIFTTFYSFLYSMPIVFTINPDLILCNGPGTCIPVCMSGFILKVTFIKDTRIVFVESFCRTETLSFTGEILAYIADNFLVQWPSLKSEVKRADYIGQLM